MTEKSAADRVLELDRAATESPWKPDPTGGFVLRKAGIVCQLFDKNEREFFNDHNNMMLIAEYRTLAPALARQVKALEAELEHAKSAINEIPTNWCDPLLTGKNAALKNKPGAYDCKDIERLLLAIKENMERKISND